MMEGKLRMMKFLLDLSRLKKKDLLFEDTTNLSIKVNWEKCIRPAQLHKEIQYLKPNHKLCSYPSIDHVILRSFVSDYNNVGVALFNAAPLTNLNPLLVSTEKGKKVLKILNMLADGDIVHLILLKEYFSLCHSEQYFEKDVGNNRENVNSVIQRSQTCTRTWNITNNEPYFLKNQPSGILQMYMLLLNQLYKIILIELLEERGK